MPTKAKKRISVPGTGEDRLRGKRWKNRPRSREEYHSARWTRESKVFREKHPLCAICLEKGLLVPSEVVDHIIPVAVCSDFWDKTNWRALCRKCNIEKEIKINV